MPPNILSGESSGGKHFKLVLEVTPPNVHVVPKVLGLHLSSFTLQGFGMHPARNAKLMQPFSSHVVAVCCFPTPDLYQPESGCFS